MKNRRASTASGVESDPISLISLQVFDMTGYVINDFRFTTRQQMGWDYWVEVNKQGNRCQAFKLRRVEADNVVIVTNMIGKGNGCCLGSYCWCGWPTVVVMSSTLHFVAKQRSLPAFRWRLVAYYEFGIKNGREIITVFSFGVDDIFSKAAEEHDFSEVASPSIECLQCFLPLLLWKSFRSRRRRS
ncbi:uncharacterized protein LOC120001360 isoform X3 [Tripterygium wilfordii]|uniref:uncharacterized protein LOC120001360 isoform X3 n=1 Tax=Tripterygium wilfordii TaxID=458696 RepID=UPI0018F82B90|nr:uncharacterized protein LOC120001360 isoform X3 [Tripterygium wilfordii]